MRIWAAIILLLGASLSTVACGAQTPKKSVAARDERLPAGVFVLLGALMPAILEQCSRTTPAPGKASWTPSAGDIRLLEASLGPALLGRPEASDTDFRKAPDGWWRQYVGIVRDGRRTIYGNFFTAPDPRYPGARKPDYSREVAVVCDGGPAFFGVEFDVEDRSFIHLDFNGSA